MTVKTFHKTADEYLASIFESSPVALISLDVRMRIVLFNRIACELTGYAPGEIVGRRVTAIIPSRRLKAATAHLRKVKQSATDGFVTVLQGKGGKEIPVRLKISPLFDSENVSIGILVLAYDLGEVRKLHSQMLEAERLAAVTETAISVNHEINNPLCSILGNTQLMLQEKESLDPGIVAKLMNIERQIERIQKIALRLGSITRPVLKEYVGGRKMLDVEESSADSKSESS